MTKAKAWILKGVGLGVVFIGIVLFFLPQIMFFAHNMELSLIDFRFRLTEPPLESDVVIVEIDNSSLSSLDTWPWPRAYYGELIRVLNRHGAKVIGIDVIFDSKSSKAQDQAFASALGETTNVVLGSRRYDQEKDGYSLSSWSRPIQILKNVSKSGFVNTLTDPDDRVRKTWFFFRENTGMEYSFDLKLTAMFLDYPSEFFILDQTKKHLLMGEKRIPYEWGDEEDPGGTYRIPYYGPQRSFLNIPFYLVLEERYPDMSVFKDKIVLIGATDQILHDFYYTPYNVMSGVEIHANTIQSLIDDRHFINSPLWLDVVIFVIVLSLIFWFSIKTAALVGFVVNAAVLAIHSLLAIHMFSDFNFLLNWAYPQIFGVLAYVSIVIAKYVKEEREKNNIKNVFQQYVSPSVVNKILNDPSRLKLGGEKQRLTIFFSDIRSFTTYTESHTPEEVVEMLNDYLDAMTKCIFQWKGTVDKYVGDEIMAIWGAPLPLDDHAQLALRCCWDQLRVLRELQEHWRSVGRDIVDIGMSLNTGDMIIGNIGSSMHKDYTVIGDSVNLGARLEAETRNHGTEENPCYLIISEYTYELVKHICKVKNLGEVTVKGKRKPVLIYEVLDVDMIPPPGD